VKVKPLFKRPARGLSSIPKGKIKSIEVSSEMLLYLGCSHPLHQSSSIHQKNRDLTASTLYTLYTENINAVIVEVWYPLFIKYILNSYSLNFIVSEELVHVCASACLCRFFYHIVTSVTLDHIVTVVTLCTIVAFVIPFVAILTSSSVMWRKENLKNTNLQSCFMY
jgi:hypothetical protein